MTWAKLVETALTRSRLLGRGLSVNPELQEEAFTCLGVLFDKLDGMGLTMPVMSQTVTFNTVSGQAKYLLGGDMDGGFSSSSVTIGGGEKVFVMDSINTPLVPGQRVVLDNGSTPLYTMTGKITAVDGFTVTVFVSGYTGSGAFTTWNMIVKSYRPNAIISAQFLLSPGVTQTSTPIPYSQGALSYLKINVKNTLGVPYNYALNPAFPQSEMYLYNVPNQAYPFYLSTKVTMNDLLGDPNFNPAEEPPLNPGVSSSLIDLLALDLAEQNDKAKPALYGNAYKARQVLTVLLKNQIPDQILNAPSGIFPWNINEAGVNYG